MDQVSDRANIEQLFHEMVHKQYWAAHYRQKRLEELSKIVLKYKLAGNVRMPGKGFVETPKE